jgi:hypothetical protein|tara:strand:- start:1052 stop:1246 length:195 start_codon:yes stop_codon:yes gene_type:complete
MNINESYNNAYKLLLGETTYNELAKQVKFYLPNNHESSKMLLKYFESIEDYEKCSKIIKIKNRL